MEQIKPLTLRHNFSWTLIGNVVYAACQWGMLVVIAKLGSPEMVGQFTLGLAITAPIVLFTNLQLRLVQATDTKHQFLFSDYLGLRIVSTGLALLVIAAIALMSGYHWETSVVILLVGLAKAFESISDVFYGLIQQHERMDRIAVSMMIKGFLSLLLLGIGVYLLGNVVWGVVGLVVAWAAILFCYDLHSGALILKNSRSTQQAEKHSTHALMHLLRPRWHLKTLKKLVWLALPLGFVMMLISLNANIPRYFIERYLGERSLGIFAALAYMTVAGYMLVCALGESVSPRLAKYYATGNSKAFRTLILKLMGIGVLLGGAGILITVFAGRTLLILLYQREYAEYANVLVWLMVGGAILYADAFLGYAMTAARYFRIQIPLFSIATGATVVACIWLIPSQGLLGAAMALIIGAVVRSIGTLSVICYALSKLQRYVNAGQV